MDQTPLSVVTMAPKGQQAHTIINVCFFYENNSKGDRYLDKHGVQPISTTTTS